jgi:hypothetical protein
VVGGLGIGTLKAQVGGTAMVSGRDSWIQCLISCTGDFASLTKLEKSEENGMTEST